MGQALNIPNSQISRFSDLGLAQSNQEHRVKPSRIVLGDDQKFWVVSPANAERLIRAGHELA